MKPAEALAPRETPRIAHVYEGRKVLITGAGGFLGSCLVQALAPVKCEIVSIQRDETAIPGGAKAKVVCRKSDISRESGWEKLLEKVDVVFHLAAQTSAVVAMEDAFSDYQINALPTLRILEACRKMKHSPVVVLAGTATEAGMTTRLPVNEDTSDRPLTVYDAHKLLAEGYLRSYVEDGFVRGTSLRLANVYGPGRLVANDRGVLNKVVARALRQEPLQVLGGGHNVRDFIYNWDVVSAFLHAGACAGALALGHYYVGTGVGWRITDAVMAVAERVEKKTGSRPKIEHVKTTERRPKIESRNFVADSGAFRSATGWAPEVGLHEGIDRMIDCFLVHVPAR